MPRQTCFRRLLIWGLLLLAAAPSANAQMPALTSRIKVYIVGTFHFNSSPTDVNHGTRVEMNTPDKQRELAEVVSRLQKTQADKVFVEWKPSEQHFVDSTYALYRQDKLKPGNNEVYQLGYRLARQLGRPRVYCADADGAFDYEAVQAFAKQHNQTAVLREGFEDGPITDSLSRLLEARIKPRQVKLTQEPKYPGEPLVSRLAYFNSEAFDRANMDAYLLLLARVGSSANYAGADLGGEFFKRNVRICTNLLRTVDVQHDRAIVLFIGAGHAAFLKSILRYSSLFEVVEVAPLLTAK